MRASFLTNDTTVLHESHRAGSLRAGQRAAAVKSLIQSARVNGHDLYRKPTEKDEKTGPQGEMKEKAIH